MADNYLITGYHGEPHVTAENDRGINAGTFGAGRFVLPVGEQFRAEYAGNNTICLFDGKLMDNGAAAGIPAGESIDFLIANAGQGMKRHDLIVFQYSKDESTPVERGSFVVVQGTETSGTAEDPALTQEDLLTNTAMFDQMALWRVVVDGTTIESPVRVFDIVNGYGNIESAEHPGCYYRMVDGEKEWVTPPMLDGVEYRLTKRFNGKPVFTTYKEIGNLPASGNQTYALGHDGDTFDNIVHFEVRAKNSSGREYPIPMYSSSGTLSAYARMGGSRTVYLLTFTDLSAYTGKIILEYTKE